MSNKLNNNELKAIGLTDSQLLQTAGKLAKSLIKAKKYTKERILELYRDIAKDPDKYTESDVFGDLARELKAKKPLLKKAQQVAQGYELKTQPAAYQVFGSEQIEKGAIEQMDTAAKLPVSVAGALMPDAHTGYGLPIGGVLATNAN
nr:RtcB family protein [Cytophagales bacterium]